ncbi:polymeric immunoglobulin receptor-like [Pluvialis apricaria]
MGLSALLLLPLCFPGLQAQTPEAEERQSEGSTLHIHCPYTAQTDYYDQKAWCRVRDDACEPLVETSDPTRYQYTTEATKGNVKIEDDHNYRTVFITMTNLQAEDSGTYSCASRSRNSRYTALRTISLNVFKGLQAQTPDAEERQSEGSTLHIRCPYTAQTDYYDQKAWCRVRDDACEPLVETSNPTRYQYETEATKGNAKIEDNHNYMTVFITMTNLQAEDSGTYSCASRSRNSRYTALRTISLNVFKELHKRELDGLSVQCPYSAPGYSTETKVWCRREGQSGCKVVVRTDYASPRRNSKALEERTLIQDDTQNRTVTINMWKLQAQDSGVYWCALYRGYSLTRIMEFKLSVSKPSAGTTLPGPTGTNQTTPSGNNSGSSSNVHTFAILTGVLSILFILALTSLITLCVRRHKQLKRRGNRQAEDTYEKPEDTVQLDITERTESPQDDSKDLKYVTLNFESQLSPEDPLYCNVEPSQAYRKPIDENVEYAIVARKQLPTNDKG